MNDDAFRHPYSDMLTMINHHGGHFIKRDMSAFNAVLLEKGARKSRAMDPQQRLLLETSNKVLQNAGIPLEKVNGSNAGVYVAAFTHEYGVVRPGSSPFCACTWVEADRWTLPSI